MLKEAYQLLQSASSKKFKSLMHALDLDPALTNGIAGKFWCDEYVVLENETFRSPISYACPDLTNNHALSVHYHDPVYDADFVFKSNILEGAM
jgi:hypothetical protein